VGAERSAQIDVTGDASALLSMVPFDGPNGDYVKEDENGALYLDFSEVAAGGVNLDAVTVIRDICVITNNGTRSVTLTLTKEGDNIDAVDFGDVEDGVMLHVGQSYVFSFTITSHGLSKDDNILRKVHLIAEAAI
jgi:hypothetical protein